MKPYAIYWQSGNFLCYKSPSALRATNANHGTIRPYDSFITGANDENVFFIVNKKLFYVNKKRTFDSTIKLWVNDVQIL